MQIFARWMKKCISRRKMEGSGGFRFFFWPGKETRYAVLFFMQTCRDIRNPSRSFKSGSVCPGLTSPKTRSCIQAPLGLPQPGMCQFAGFLRAITVCGAGVPRKPDALTPQGSSSFCSTNVGRPFFHLAQLGLACCLSFPLPWNFTLPKALAHTAASCRVLGSAVIQSVLRAFPAPQKMFLEACIASSCFTYTH